MNSNSASLSLEEQTAPPPEGVPSPNTGISDPDAEVLLLNFVCRRKSRSILNCTVVGSDGYTPYFHIMTCDDIHQMCTLFRTNEGRTIAAVQWGGNGSTACVYIHKTVDMEPVSRWLSLSADARQPNFVSSASGYSLS